METILAHQKKVISLIAKEEKFNKFLLFHSTGSGKTTTALLAAFDTNYDVVILTPKATTSDWMGRIAVVKSYMDTINITYDGAIVVSGYSYFLKHPSALDKMRTNKTVVIIDEAHNIRKPLTSKEIFNDVLYTYYMSTLPQESKNYIEDEFYKNKTISDSNKWILLLNELRKMDSKFKLLKDMKICRKKASTWFIYLATLLAHKTLFLTATPIVNAYPKDIKNLSLMLYSDDINFTNIPMDTIKRTILYYNMSKDPKYKDKFPTVSTKVILIKDPAYVISSGIPEYADFSKHGFLIAANIVSRLSVAGLLDYMGPKITQIINILADQVPTKVFIHSRWVQQGVKKVFKILIDAYPTAEITILTGQTSVENTSKILHRFNDLDTDTITKILIVSSVGIEGINLYGVRHVFLLEPPWTNAHYIQTIARAVRYGSHVHLPEDERTVHIYRLILSNTFDELIMNDFSENKKRFEQRFLSYVTEV
jgi:hypothetical protein